MSLEVTAIGFMPTDGPVELDDRHSFVNACRVFAGKEIELIMRERRYQRSRAQNDYWRGVVCEIMGAELGYTKNEVSYVLLGEWGGYKPGPNGHEIPNHLHTSDLTVKEFAELIEWAQQFAAEQGVRIPDPNPNWRNEAAS